jgi:hypothetical protein
VIASGSPDPSIGVPGIGYAAEREQEREAGRRRQAGVAEREAQIAARRPPLPLFTPPRSPRANRKRGYVQPYPWGNHHG